MLVIALCGDVLEGSDFEDTQANAENGHPHLLQHATRRLPSQTSMGPAQFVRNGFSLWLRWSGLFWNSLYREMTVPGHFWAAMSPQPPHLFR
jgi:hypothetical protein